jgi:hypothetical protein
MNKPEPRLINILIGKSIVETVFVAALALVFRVDVLPPTFHGWGELDAVQQSVKGWAVDNADPWKRVEVQLVIDDRLYGTQVASLSRPDVSNAGWSKDEWHGYSFKVPSLTPGQHEARVYTLHRSEKDGPYTMQLLGDPIRFTVGNDGTARGVSR